MISDLERIVQRFIQDYQDLNPSNATELNHSPSSLEFSELVRTNRPLVVRGPNTRASQNWTNQYLIEKLGEKKLEISISPDGYVLQLISEQWELLITLLDMLIR